MLFTHIPAFLQRGRGPRELFLPGGNKKGGNKKEEKEQIINIRIR